MKKCIAMSYKIATPFYYKIYMKKCVALTYNIAMHFFIIKSIWKSAWRYVISWRTFSYGFYNKKVRCDLWPNVLWLVVICTYDQGHLKISIWPGHCPSLQSIESVWSVWFGSSRFKSVWVSLSQFELALFNLSRFESVQIEPPRVGLTALIELNRTEWATSIPRLTYA